MVAAGPDETLDAEAGQAGGAVEVGTGDEKAEAAIGDAEVEAGIETEEVCILLVTEAFRSS